ASAPCACAALPVMVQLASVAPGPPRLLIAPPSPAAVLPEMGQRAAVRAPSAAIPPPSWPAAQAKIEVRDMVSEEPARAQIPPPGPLAAPRVMFSPLMMSAALDST